MEQSETRVFDTTDEAVTFLYNNPDFDGELEVRETEDVSLVDCSEVEGETTHNPDLPVRQGDKTHRSLWLLQRHEADCPERTLSPPSVLNQSTAEEFDVNKALNSLVKGGYANKRKIGIKPFFYITEKGERLLEELDEPAEEISGQPVHLGNGTKENPFEA